MLDAAPPRRARRRRGGAGPGAGWWVGCDGNRRGGGGGGTRGPPHVEGADLKLRPEEITSILRERIEQYDVETDLAEVGTVLQVGDGIARVYGLENAVAMEMLELEHGVVGLAFNLEEDQVGAALFGEWERVKEGEPVRRTGKVASVPGGEASLGRVVDPLGNPLGGRRPLDTKERRR